MTRFYRAIVVFAIVLGILGAGLLSASHDARAGGGGGCHSEESTAATGTSVNMVKNCFFPTVLHIQPGQAVTWTNRDPVSHTVTGAMAEWGDHTSRTDGQTVSFTFERPGTYVYYCAFHIGMIGAIVVGDGRGSGAATLVQAAPAPTRSAEAVAAVAAPSQGSTTLPATKSGSSRDGNSYLGYGLVGLFGLVAGGGAGVAIRRKRV